MPCERKHVEAIANAVFAADKNGCEFDCFCAICSAVGNVESAITSALDACDQSPWRSMDSAPRDEQTAVMLLSETGWIYIGVYWECYNDWVDRDEFMRLPLITHWMPLPEAPRKGGE